MNKKKIIFYIMLVIVFLTICVTIMGNGATTLGIEATEEEEIYVTANLQPSTSYAQDAAEYNTAELQRVIDEVSNSGGGTVYIPAGTYYFASAGLNRRGHNDYVILCKNNVLVEGAGNSETTGTIFKPYGATNKGLDMFYFNEYVDSSFTNPEYLVNADFKNFVINSKETSSNTYSSAGKGFMFNLFKDCDWENVKVKNTDGTGFGMDCPINCTVKNCEAVGCGKRATQNDVGASGFGIGTGYSTEESIHIMDCKSTNNTKFGFFFEHQGRFNGHYPANKSKGFVVSNCTASGNLYDLGGNRGNDVTYENCTADKAIQFENNARRIHIVNCNTNMKFTDVTDSTASYYDAVYWAVNKAITTNDTRFYPDVSCTRADAIMFLWKMNERPGDVVFGSKPQIETGFSDVPYTDTYVDAIKWAVDKNIIETSTVLTEFYPDVSCTRADFITFLWKSAGRPEIGSINNFNDIESGSYYESAVNWAVNKGIIDDSGNNQFLPESVYTRGEVITIIYKYITGQNTFNITYNLNGGTEVENPTTYNSGSNTFNLNNPTRVGYTFTGWTGSNYNVEGYLGENQYVPQKNVTITTDDTGHKAYTANWRKIEYIEYTVEHYKQNINGEYPSEATEKEVLEVDKGTSVEPNVKEYEGFTAPNKKIVEIDKTGIVIRYEYTRNEYTLTIEKGENIESVTGSGKYKYEQEVKIEAVAKTGYGNITWNGDKTSEEFHMPALDITIKVDATPIEYNITYDLEGGKATGNPVTYNIETETFTLNNPTRIGYTFIGWTGSNGTTLETEVIIEKGTTGNLSYTANWEEKKEDVKEELKVQVSYSTKQLTNKNVTVIISANNKINKIEGWTLSADRKSIYKEYEKNTKEEIKIIDEYSNQVTKIIEITNIDKEPPEVTIEYKLEGKTVIVTINANEDIQEIKGWKLSDDKRMLQKTYDINKSEEVIIKDIAGNHTKKNIIIDQIKQDDSNDDNIDDNNKNEDTTIIPDGKLPQTGINEGITCIFILILLIAGIISYKKIRKYKDF